MGSCLHGNEFGATEKCTADNWAAEYAKKLTENEAIERTDAVNELDSRIINIAEDVDYARTLISEETTARTAADAELQNKIEAEVSARQKTDTEITQRLDSFMNTSAYISVSEIDEAISQEISERTRVDSSLQELINAEEEARKQADTELGLKIGSETIERTDAVEELDSRITDFNSSLSAEARTRANADMALQNSITSEVTARTSAVTELQNNLNTEVSARQEADTELSDGLAAKLEKSIVAGLPSEPKLYDFEDGVSRFSTPSISGSSKGEAIVLTDDSGNQYQSVAVSSSSTIGSSANVYSSFDFSAVTKDATKVKIEMDFQYVKNGRFRMAFADLDVINALGNSEIRYNTDGIALDLFSTNGNKVQINGNGKTLEALFGAWVHGEFVFNFKQKVVTYMIYSPDVLFDEWTGSVSFRDTNCDRITGIALYTWLQGDTVYLDNIKITSEVESTENKLYLLDTGDNVYEGYMYIDGVATKLFSTDTQSKIEKLQEQINALMQLG